MNYKTLSRALVGVGLVAILSLTIGCGGGGPAGPTTDYLNTSVTAPDTQKTLVTPSSVYNYSPTAANVSLVIPVSNENVKFALTVTNSGSSKQTVNVKPESYVNVFAASVRENIRAALTDDLDEIRIKQMPLQARFREDFINSMRPSGGKVLANKSLRLADNRGEEEGQIVKLQIIADSGGYSYQTIDCKLVRISDHCKFFVDQGTHNGISAIDAGPYKLTAEDIQHFVDEFETHIHDLMTKNYGNPYDIDQDGRLSVVFSPVYASFGYAGLFNSIDLSPANPSNSNQRDLIALWSPNGKWTGETYREATRETIAHEMQHIINMSAKVYPGGVLRTPVPTDYDNWLETPWLDESLAVGCEVRYRLKRGSPARENRFDRWAANPHSVRMDSFSYQFMAFEHYGQKGLFNFYLFEQYGAEKIKELVQSTAIGTANVEAVYGLGFADLVKNWSVAVMNESLRFKGLINVAKIIPRYKYTANLQLNIVSENISYGQTPKSFTLNPNASAYYVINQPAGFGDSEYRFRIESKEGQPIEIMMLRLPTP